MSKFFLAAACIAIPMLLNGCGTTKNIQSIKSTDYSDKIHAIVAVVEAPSLDPRFQAAFADSASRCGTVVTYAHPLPGQPVKVEAGDGILIIHEVGHETKTQGTSWISMVRLQAALTDFKSKKTVWKGQADFRIADLYGVPESDPTQRWGDDLASLMEKDGLFEKCDLNRKRVPVPSK